MKHKMVRKRLDQALVEQGVIRSRERAKAMIMAGKVLVNGIKIDKPGTQVNHDARIEVKAPDHPYVSRGGLKLEKALLSFPVSVQDAVCLDIGASTGGFTDCLLKFGAKKVFAVDVGYGQIDWSLRQNSRVVVIERTNIRHLPYEAIGRPMDAVVADTSFISLKTVIPSAEQFMRHGTDILALIKPQFEAGKENVGKGGIVKDPEIRNLVKQDIIQFFSNRGYKVNGTVTSPVLGAKGNEEYVISLVYQKK
ncbi:MAG: TlyA family RNA methyltransferase [Desulfobacterales bacterium]|nr:TlyA family RNA methyltransferase [Desulfobacterales bacterium]